MARQWMPMYWGDYARKTQHLSTAEHGAYLLLISHYWNTASPLPDNDDVLRRITRTTAKQWNSMRETIAGFFEIGGGYWHHERVDCELRTSAGVSTLQSSRASEGWKTRKNQQPSDATGNAPAMPRARVTTTTTTVDDKSSTLPVPRQPVGYTPEFEVFWQQYPKNGASKKEAARSYQRAIQQGATHETIIRGVAAYGRYIERNGDLVAHATTWLNQHRWETDYDSIPARDRSPGGRRESSHDVMGRAWAGVAASDPDRRGD